MATVPPLRDLLSNPFKAGYGALPRVFAGREPEFRDLEVMAARTRAGIYEQARRVQGIRGIGKTVLLGEYEQWASDSGLWVTSLTVAPGAGFAGRAMGSTAPTRSPRAAPSPSWRWRTGEQSCPWSSRPVAAMSDSSPGLVDADRAASPHQSLAATEQCETHEDEDGDGDGEQHGPESRGVASLPAIVRRHCVRCRSRPATRRAASGHGGASTRRHRGTSSPSPQGRRSRGHAAAAGQRLSRSMPAPTVRLVVSSMRMKLPVERLRA